MLNTSKFLSRSLFATLGAVLLTTTAISTAHADHQRRGYGAKHQKVVIYKSEWRGHKHRRARHWRHNHRRAPVVVRHVQRERVVYRDYQQTSSPNVSSTFGGGIIGAVLGAALGTQFGKGSGKTAAIVTGGLIGAVVGGNVGASMEEADRRRSQQVLETAPTSTPVAWRNPDNGAAYRVTPTRTYQTASGQYCRDYSTWAFIDGYEEEVKGTACRTADGTWAARPNG